MFPSRAPAASSVGQQVIAPPNQATQEALASGEDTAEGKHVNYTFITHFQKIAQAHFTVRRLERICGKELVRTQYERIRDELVGVGEFAA